MSMFSNYFKVPFYQGDIGKHTKPLSNWVIFLCAFMSFALMVTTNYLIHNFLSLDPRFVSIGCTIAATLITCFWLSRHFYKKNKRVMTVIEYKEVLKKFLISFVGINLFFILAIIGFFYLQHLHCAHQLDYRCVQMNTRFDQAAQHLASVFVVLTVMVIFMTLVMWFLISTSLKGSIHTIEKRYIHLKKKNETS